jgi:hypothetical protein
MVGIVSMCVALMLIFLLRVLGSDLSTSSYCVKGFIVRIAIIADFSRPAVLVVVHSQVKETCVDSIMKFE